MIRRARLKEQQVKTIHAMLDMAHPDVENELLEKWDAFSVGDLNYVDYEKIVADIERLDKNYSTLDE